MQPIQSDSTTDAFTPDDHGVISDPKLVKDLYRLLVCGGINNDSEVLEKEIPDQGITFIPLGDPTDAALLTLFRKSGLDEPGLKERYKVVAEFPFESELKRMSKITYDGDGHLVLTKGATEVILPHNYNLDIHCHNRIHMENYYKLHIQITLNINIVL